MAIPQDRDGTTSPVQEPLRVGIVGLVHTHVHWILGRKPKEDIEIVGIVEPNRELAQRYCKQHGYSMDIVFDSMEAMCAATKPEAVTAFNTIWGHLEVVKFCAPRGIHVMVEKPLAISLEHAEQMKELAQKHQIELLTNYETSWYPSTHEVCRLVREKKIPAIQKMNFFTGHQGPIEIGCNKEFVEWLIDPEFNGGGALTDFGCYGANIATWLLRGEAPESVTCVTRQCKPDKYPLVDDDATIVLDYKDKQVVIQASWNWSHNRKEMELFGRTGCVKCFNGTEMEVMFDEKNGAKKLSVEKRDDKPNDPFAMFAGVIKGGQQLEKFDVSSLENNYLVMQILEAAKLSASRKRTVFWNEMK